MPSGGLTYRRNTRSSELELIARRTEVLEHMFYIEKKKTTKKQGAQNKDKEGVKIVLENGEEDNLDMNRLEEMVKEACEGLEDTNPQLILKGK